MERTETIWKEIEITDFSKETKKWKECIDRILLSFKNNEWIDEQFVKIKRVKWKTHLPNWKTIEKVWYYWISELSDSEYASMYSNSKHH